MGDIIAKRKYCDGNDPQQDIRDQSIVTTAMTMTIVVVTMVMVVMVMVMMEIRRKSDISTAINQ